MARRRLALRLYGLTAAIVVATMAALYVLPHFVGSPRYLEPQAALVQNMVDRLGIRLREDPHRFAEAMTRIASRLHGSLTLYDAQGNVVRSTVDPPNHAPTRAELARMGEEKWALDWHRIVVRSDDGQMIGVYVPSIPGFPWAFVLPLGAGVLLVVGAATLWFSRRLVRPLDQLATAARRFGAGDTAARAALRRDDELGDVGRAFDDMADRTAALITAQRQLMADVSHELRTPLARIRVALELAAEDPAAAKDVLSDVGTDLDEIEQLIADILTTARLDIERAPITKKATTVGELAELSARRFAARHPSRALSRQVAGEAREIECDPVLLRRALDNLLDNAAKYSAVDQPVTLDIQPNGTAVTFEVVDRGIGMTAEELERAGTPFWRADGSRTRKTGGVGLGLALARRIARAHGGDVTLASKPGEGTTARLEIPLPPGAP
ncbi:MAG TPA: HAMP domain-containing sensor histidine kinase [Kofleriaceae bacterium]|nr:HAMP domain-containing sensor histidine kinase [Kofleriaceae bacterium]